MSPSVGHSDRLAGMQVGDYTATILEVPDCALTEALALNDAGQVVGYAVGTRGDRRAALWHGGRVTDLGALPGTTSSEAWDINHDGEVVGLCHDGDGRRYRAFRWDGRRMLPLPDLGGPASACAINALGQIAGGSYVKPMLASAEHHAVLWGAGGLSDLGALPGGRRDSHAWDLNTAGQVVGFAQDAEGANRAVVWQGQDLVDLGIAGIESAALAVNAAGAIAGTTRMAGGALHAFVWREGRVLDLNPSGPAHISRAYDISDSGQVVGAVALRSPREARPWAVMWREGRTVDLNETLDLQSGCRLTCARGINNHGQIVAQGVINGRK